MNPPQYEQTPSCDILPNYQSGVALAGRLLCKQELVTPDTSATLQHWRQVEAELRGTTLLLFEVSGTGSSVRNLPSPSHFRSYTLQAGDAGLATDYKRRPDVVRARVEGEQLLFIAPGVEAASAWVEGLLTGISISEPLENRKMPRYPSLPSRRERRDTEPWERHVAGTGLRQRLWIEMAWHSRRREEWLLEMPSRSRGERWRTVVCGPKVDRCRRRSTSLGPNSTTLLGSGDQTRSTRSGCQSPCSACGVNIARVDSIEEIEEIKEGLTNHTSLDGGRSSSEQSIPCTRILTKRSVWKGGFYIKNGRRISIPPYPSWA